MRCRACHLQALPTPPLLERWVFPAGASLPLLRSLETGAVSTRLEAGREEGDSRRRGQQAALGDRAPLSQQRRLRQATQFLHKDSADLLPLDSLKRLGTSKDLQPHSVIQRRLVEGNQSQLQGESPLVQALIHGQESRRKTSKTEIPALLVNCKVLKAPGGGLAPGPPTQVEQLELQLGQETVACSAQVVDVESPEFCLGLQTLLSLKCCIDLERGVLRLRAPFPELPFLPLYQEPGQ
ncbi:hypothetical protein GH733_014631 [Mirounga leonina]|nr:hypothetical protein GH733_014631 [Mirounga leonina]